MELKISLDEFRRNDLGYSTSKIDYENHGIIIPFTFNDYFNTTMDFFLDALARFENPLSVPIAYNPFYLTIFTNFFSVLEQFISTTYELVYFCCKSNNIPTDEENKKIFRKEYHKTLKQIFIDSNSDDKEFKTNKMFNMLTDIANSRNYILHGNIGEIKIEKTNLPKSPLTINIEDIMEEINIILNLMIHFRFLIPELDLMPNVRIKYSNTILFKKFDSFYYEVLVPYFEKILTKHSLTKTREFSRILKPLPSISKNIIAKHIGNTMKAKPSEFFDKFNMNDKQTSYYNYYLLNIIKPLEVLELEDNNLFQLPNFKS